MPWTWHFGPLALSPYRLVLLTMVVPCLFFWITGRTGRIRSADVTLLLYCLWCSISLLVNHGYEASLQPAGILFVETAGAYLIARYYIRNADNFRDMIRLLFLIVVILLPFAVLEAVTRRNVLLEFCSLILPVLPTTDNLPVLPTTDNALRWGLARVRSVVEHPILFGVVCGSIFALAHLVLGCGEKAGRRWFRTGIVGATAFLSLSAGPITALAAQALLLCWNWFLREYAYRWRLLLAMVSTMWGCISLVANRSVPNLYLSYFSFDESSAYFRILIWTFGTESVLNHPFFGVGLNSWDRPSWMPPSIDMFWLIHAVLYGIPAAILMLLTLLLPLLSIGLLKGLNDRLEQYRAGYVIAMTGFFLVGWTVHFWSATYVLFLFLLGSGLWLLDVNPTGRDSTDTRPSLPARRLKARPPPRNRPQAGGPDGMVTRIARSR